MINISKTSLERDIQAGYKKEEIRIKYSNETIKLSNNDVTKLLKDAGLRIKNRKPTFVLIDDTIATLPLDPTVALECKNEAEKGNQLVDFSGQYNNLTK